MFYVRFILAAIALSLFALPVLAAEDAASLGPSTSSSSLSDPGTASLLQPANPSSLQAGNEGGGASQAAPSNSLQPAGNQGQFRELVVNDSDGSANNTPLEPESSNTLLIGILFGIAIIGGLLALTLLENRRITGLRGIPEYTKETNDNTPKPPVNTESDSSPASYPVNEPTPPTAEEPAEAPKKDSAS